MSQDELDELFGEEFVEGSPMDEDNLPVKNQADSEKEESSESEMEGETLTKNAPVEINELALPTVQTPSNRGLIVIF